MSEEVTTGLRRLRTYKAPGFWDTAVGSRYAATGADAAGERGQRGAGVGAPARAPPAALRPARPGTSSPKARPEALHVVAAGPPAPAFVLLSLRPETHPDAHSRPCAYSVDVPAASLMKIPPKCRTGAVCFPLTELWPTSGPGFFF